MDDGLEDSREIRAGYHVVELDAHLALESACLAQLLIEALRPLDVELDEVVHVGLVARPLGAAQHELKGIEVVVDKVQERVEVFGRQLSAKGCLAFWNEVEMRLLRLAKLVQKAIGRRGDYGVEQVGLALVVTIEGPLGEPCLAYDSA